MTVGRDAREAFFDALVYDDPVQLYERAPCGFLSTTPDGVIVKANATFRDWIGYSAAELVGERRFAELLTPGGRIYHETHYAPMLRMHGHARELALELVRKDGSRLPVLVNATLDRDEEGEARVVRIAVFDATERRRYERELLHAKQQAEVSEERARALARTLQQTLIPPSAPTIPGLELAAAYRPAGEGVEVGGDFYDVFSIGAGDWVVALGDVSGKGVDAAVVTALARFTLRAATVAFDEPARALDNLNEVLRHHETQRFCTVTLVRLRSDGIGWRASIGTAGHPPPVLLRPGLDPQWCGGSGPLVGVLEHPGFVDRELLLEPGDTLLLYTDGVTEGRRGAELFGEDRLLAAAAALGGEPAALVDGLVTEVLGFQDGRARDDVAVLALRVPPVGPSQDSP